MSRPITDLPAGALVNLMETNGENTVGKPWRIIATADKNPYKIFVFIMSYSSKLTATSEYAYKCNNDANQLKYDNCLCYI